MAARGAAAAAVMRRLQAALAVPAVLRDAAHGKAVRARLDEAIAALEGGRFSLDSIGELALPPARLAWDGNDDRDRLRRLARALRASCPALDLQRPAPDPAQDGRIRLGLLLPEASPVARVVALALADDLPRDCFSVTVLQVGPPPIGGAGEAASRLRTLPAGPVALRTIAAAGLDLLLLVDPGEPLAWLAGLVRLAPCQVVLSLGGGPTGLPEIDVRLAWTGAEPEGAERHDAPPPLFLNHAPGRLPGLSDQPVAGLPPGRRLYGLLEGVDRMVPELDPVLAAIAAADPLAMFVVAGTSPGDGAALARRLGRQRRRLGGRLIAVEQPVGAVVRHLDVVVAAPHAGDAAVRWALAAGVPAVAAPGRWGRSRAAAALLQRLDLSEGVGTGAPDDLARRAVRLARDGAARADWMRRLEEVPALLGDLDRGFVVDVARALAEVHGAVASRPGSCAIAKKAVGAPRLTVHGIGWLDGRFGYNIHARGLLAAIGRRLPVIETDQQRPEEAAAGREAAIALAAAGRPVAHVAVLPPDVAGPLLAGLRGPRVGFAVWETTVLPANWIAPLSELDQIWTPSEWGRDLLLANGIDGGRVRVVPEGVDPLVFHPEGGGVDWIRRLGGFRFCAVGRFEPRKGVADLLKAFDDEFQDDPHVRLVVACDNPFDAGFDLKAKLASLELKSPDRIHFLQPVRRHADMARIYRSCHAFVSATRAEAWGLPIIEAMASGLPTVVTGYSGLTAFATPETAELVRYRLARVEEQRFQAAGGDPGMWAIPDVAHLRRQMRRLVESPSAAAERGRVASRIVRERFTWERAAGAAIEALAELL